MPQKDLQPRRRPMTFYEAGHDAVVKKHGRETSYNTSDRSWRLVEAFIWELSYGFLIAQGVVGEIQTVTFTWKPKSPSELEFYAGHSHPLRPARRLDGGR